MVEFTDSREIEHIHTSKIHSHILPHWNLFKIMLKSLIRCRKLGKRWHGVGRDKKPVSENRATTTFALNFWSLDKTTMVLRLIYRVLRYFINIFLKFWHKICAFYASSYNWFLIVLIINNCSITPVEIVCYDRSLRNQQCMSFKKFHERQIYIIYIK